MMLAVTLLVVAAAAGAGTLPCTAIPKEAFHPATELFPKGLADEAKLASTGRTLGVLLPELPEGFRLLLFRGQRRVGEYWLPNPKERPFAKVPRLILGDNGHLAVLKAGEFAAIYATGTLLATVDGEEVFGGSASVGRSYIFWAPIATPGQNLSFSRMRTFADLEEKELPALLLRSEWDGSQMKAVLRLDATALEQQRTAGGRVDLVTPRLLPVARPDGLVWAVGLYRGEVRLLADDGTLKGRWELAGLTGPMDDEEMRNKLAEIERVEGEKLAQKYLALYSHDATKRPSKGATYAARIYTPLVYAAFSRGKDLVLVLATLAPPPGSLLLLRDGDEVGTCFSLPEQYRPRWGEYGNLEGGQVVVTDDAIWLRQPFGHIPWETVDALRNDAEEAPGDAPPPPTAHSLREP